MPDIQQLVLAKMQSLSLAQQESVLHFIEQLSPPDVIQSKEQLEELLLDGLDSLGRGEGIEATDEWWEQERSAFTRSAEMAS
jgi:hypothetical protein